MRAVNLIPPEERRGEKAPLRTGSLPYVIVGVLALALTGLVVVVLTGNKISDRRAQLASLESQVTAAKAQADRLTPYTAFASMQQARRATVASLASSRFDWERVLREMAIVIPHDVWLTDLTASAAPGSGSSTSGDTSGAAQGITGPSLDIQGCSHGHKGVAKFLGALRDVDGVTRASVISSERPNSGNTSTTSTSSSSSQDSTLACSTDKFVAKFEVVVAFDAAQPALPDSSTAPTTSASSTAQPTVDQSSSSGGDAQSQPQPSGDATSAVVSGTGSAP
jgi:Tfp pilus assembly protein PilN